MIWQTTAEELETNKEQQILRKRSTCWFNINYSETIK